MTQLLPRNSREGRLLRRVRDTILESAPSDQEIIQRLQRAHLRGGSRKLLWKRWAPLASGTLIGVLLCGTALAWAFSTGRIVLTQRTAPLRTEPSLFQPPLQETSSSVVKDRDDHAIEIIHPAPPAASDYDHSVPPGPELADETVGPEALRTPSAAPSQITRSVAQRDKVSAKDDWIKVAARMREGDYAAARHALSNLVRAKQPDTREAAEILDIQLRQRLSDRPLKDADRKRLTNLSQFGHSPSVRSAAKRLLRNNKPTHSTKSARDPQDVAPMK